MILRRLAQSLKEQNWTAVTIEFVLLVAGVFLGIQVANWNETRREHAREQAYLRSIAAELDESIASIQRSIELSNDRTALDELLLKAVADPEAVRAEPGRFLRAITEGGYTFVPTIRGFTFEAIKATGDLDVIRDKQLVLDLMKFYADNESKAQWTAHRAYCQGEYTRRSAGILSAEQLMSAPSLRITGSGDEAFTDVESAMAARQRMLERPEFIEWVPTTLFNRTTDVRYGNSSLASARDLRARLLPVSGVPAGGE